MKKKMLNKITIDALNEDSKNDENLRNKILETSTLIELNVTPLCDYAQDKAILFRMLPGIIIDAAYREHFNTKSLYTYLSDADFRLNGSDSLFLFDFRYLCSIPKDELKKRVATLRLKQQLLSDIQVKLSSHINRSGVLFVY